ncbi:hypothetical protein CF319_g8148 [Tilletia indica]|nr:hypothetical protein CF319_g8148 [Tilletia indica]KAE8228424.1 hypothetical protein CF326_g6642 [Tilletia indica]
MPNVQPGTTAAQVLGLFAAFERCEPPKAYRTQLCISALILVAVLGLAGWPTYVRYRERSLWILRIQRTRGGHKLYICNNIYILFVVGVVYYALSYVLAWIEVLYIVDHQVWRGLSRTLQWLPLFWAAWLSILGTFRVSPGFMLRMPPNKGILVRLLGEEMDILNNILLVAGPAALTVVQLPIGVSAFIAYRDALNQLHAFLPDIVVLPPDQILSSDQAAQATRVWQSFKFYIDLESTSLLLWGIIAGTTILGIAILCVFMIKHLRREMDRELSLVGFGLLGVTCRWNNHAERLITCPIADAAASEAENAAHSKFFPRLAATPRPRGASVISSPQSKASMIGSAIMNVTIMSLFIGGGAALYTFIALFSSVQIREGVNASSNELCHRSWFCLTIVLWLNHVAAIFLSICIYLKAFDPVIDGISRQHSVFVREDHVSRKFDCVDKKDWHQPFVVRWFAQGAGGTVIEDGMRGKHVKSSPATRTFSDASSRQCASGHPSSSTATGFDKTDPEEGYDADMDMYRTKTATSNLGAESYPLHLIRTTDSAPLIASDPYSEQEGLLPPGAYTGEHMIVTQHIEYTQQTQITATPVEGMEPLEQQHSRNEGQTSRRRPRFR